MKWLSNMRPKETQYSSNKNSIIKRLRIIIQLSIPVSAILWISNYYERIYRWILIKKSFESLKKTMEELSISIIKV